ncbi:hypothetical protein M0802_002230 [Mischocyttarus mexicanus]|nr:hypothetical protein M0802_002230 [Mischocyttarus mexicanus]
MKAFMDLIAPGFPHFIMYLRLVNVISRARSFVRELTGASKPSATKPGGGGGEEKEEGGKETKKEGGVEGGGGEGGKRQRLAGLPGLPNRDCTKLFG